jgi:hypothetical protein
MVRVCTLEGGTYSLPPSNFELRVTTAAPHHTITKTPVNTWALCDAPSILVGADSPIILKQREH